MGNVISMNLIHNSLKSKKENSNKNKYKEDPILSTKYCFYCKKNFKNKIEYNEHLRYCKNGDL
jgi:hypothetical protein